MTEIQAKRVIKLLEEINERLSGFEKKLDRMTSLLGFRADNSGIEALNIVARTPR